MKRKHVALLIAATLAWCSMGTMTARAEGNPLLCECYNGSNTGRQNYLDTADPVTSSLVRTESGWMRVQGDQYGSPLANKILVEYYDTKFYLTDRKIIDMELPIYGGFYAASDGCYYVITGQNNTSHDDTLPVFHIAKYNQEWMLLGSTELKGANTKYPFSGGSLRCDDNGKELVIHTCHTMYPDTDGVSHQANMHVRLDMNSLKITEANYELRKSSVMGYDSHSFNQFILLDGEQFAVIDHGDAYPRSIRLCTGKLTGAVSSSTKVDLFTFGDNTIGNNRTGASVGGFCKSSTHYLIAGSTIEQSNFSKSNTRNIYISAVPVNSLKNASVRTVNVTSHPEGEASATTPHLVDNEDDTFTLLWEWEERVYYTIVQKDGSCGTIYDFSGHLSDCVPVCDDGQVVWYNWDNQLLTFYTISLKDPSQWTETNIQSGHQFRQQSEMDENGTVKYVCENCGESKEEMYITDFAPVWEWAWNNQFYWDLYPVVDANTTLWLKFSLEKSSSEYTDTEMVYEITDGAENVEREGNRFLTLEQDAPETSFTLRIYPKSNPACVKESVIQIKHTYETVIEKDPTMESEGLAVHTCTGCGHVWREKLPALSGDAEPSQGDVTRDGTINASDAAQILIAAAAIGAGNESGLTDAQEAVADVNDDGTINASDAAVVLIYAAAIGAGQDVKLTDFVH